MNRDPRKRLASGDVERIRDLRYRERLTQAATAAIIGCSEATVRRYAPAPDYDADSYVGRYGKPLFSVDHVSGCWVWQASLNHAGYGMICRPPSCERLAHRWVFERERGPIPGGLELDHLCRKPACVNPAHLEPVTHTENVRRSGTAVLTPSDVERIRVEAQEIPGSMRHASRVLAAQYDMTPEGIRNILLGRTWKKGAA